MIIFIIVSILIGRNGTLHITDSIDKESYAVEVDNFAETIEYEGLTSMREYTIEFGLNNGATRLTFVPEEEDGVLAYSVGTD